MKSLLTIILIISFYSCSDSEIKELQAKHKLETDSIKSLYESKESILLELTEVISEVQASVSDVSRKTGNLQQLNKAKSSDKSNITNIKDLIASELSIIENEISENKKTISRLHTRLANSGDANSKLKVIVENLQETINNKEEEISFLKDELIKKESELEEAFVTINDNYKKIKSLNKNLETVFYILKTEDELEENSIVERHGGFLGINSKLTLTNNFSFDKFTESNIKRLNQIEIPVDINDFEVLSNHPEKSYSVSNKNGKSILVIKNKSEFWSVSKFIAVVID